MKNNKPSKWIAWTCVLIFIFFGALFFIDNELYWDLMREDHILEWITFFCLLGAGVWSLYNSYLSRHLNRKRAVFFLSFGLFFLFFALEEISWGQRVLAIDTPKYFLKNSAQPETNLHNLLQGLTKKLINMKFVLALTVMVYGYVMPRRPRHKWVMKARAKGLVLPPKFLGPAFIAGTIAMLDIPTSHEEELGECIFSICFLAFMGYEYFSIRRQTAKPPVTQKPFSPNAVRGHSGGKIEAYPK